MIVKVKWIPWILLVGGVLAIFVCEGEDVFWGVVSAIIGGIWVYLQASSSKKKTVPAKAAAPTETPRNTTLYTANTTVAAPAAATTVANKTQSAPADTQPKTKRCPSCGNIENMEMFFCSKCGAKL